MTTRPSGVHCKKRQLPGINCLDGMDSRVEWVLGYDLCVPGSVLDRPQDPAARDHIQAGGQFAAIWNIRETARITWTQLDNSSRIRRAILARPKQHKETFAPGELFTSTISNFQVDQTRFTIITHLTVGVDLLLLHSKDMEPRG